MSYIILSLALFTIGVYGVLSSKHLLKIFLFLEVMTAAANMLIAAFAAYQKINPVFGQVFIVAVWAVSIANAVVFVALAVYLWKKYGTVNIDALRELRH
ncbi:MAG: NADH-quinone oxidoreductase subunit NuoK [bacterium]|nr:NADH-quinone oxidoreductase subunit NuoK [bacterium]